MGRSAFVAFIVSVGLLVQCTSGKPVGTGHVARVTQALSPPAWAESQVIEPSDAQTDDDFGNAIAMSGSTALVGAPWHDSSWGAAYVFERSGSSWAEQQKLVPKNQQSSDLLGTAVALDSNTALITTYRWTAGASVFVRSGSTWTEQQKLFPGDGGPGGGFGVSAALSGDTAIVGQANQQAQTAPGAAYVFVRSGSTWTEQQKLVPDDSADWDQFGIAVALSGDTALVGAWAPFTNPGAVYVFTRSGSVWTQQQKLSASDAATGDEFGTAIAIDGDTSIVAGQAQYVLVRSGTTWSEQQKLLPGGAQARPGLAVALAGDTALGGGFDNSSQGTAFVFERTGTTWTEQQALAPVESYASSFGNSVALQPGLALVGATKYEAGGNHDIVVAFNLGPPNGTACTSAADCASTHCVDGVCCDTSCSGACDACSIATGAAQDGTCSAVPKGSPGSPSCAPGTCNGFDADCPCVKNSDCATGACVVATGRCAGAGSAGTSCTNGSACLSGYCAEGICCDSQCDGPCETCSGGQDALSLGTCTPLPRGATPSSSCGRYLCDGQSGQCPDYCGKNDTCAPGFACSSKDECIPPVGECSADRSQAKRLQGDSYCAPYYCDPATNWCAFVCHDDTDCVSGYHCSQQRCASDYVPNNRPWDFSICDCRTAGRRQNSDAPLALLLGLLVLALRRSRC